MQAIKNKIRSRRGASLTFALLLFLVCAVVGSVVLTAGTAASGRMSRIAEMDQRYYSVNSAARLLIDTIHDKDVTIIETKSDGASPTYKKSGSDSEIQSFSSIAEEAAYFYITEVYGKEGTRIQRTKTQGDVTLFQIPLTVSDNTAVNLTIQEEMEDSGNLILTVAQGTENDTYAMKLSFTLDARPIKEVQPNKTVTTWHMKWNIRSVEVLGSNRWKE